jgi:lysine-N-methylase
MQLDAPMREKYALNAPELLDAVAEEGGALIMRRDVKTDYCVRFEDGLCGIHKKYGSAFLGDACHFYPRVTRGLGDEAVMTATPSCPEVARLAFSADAPFALKESESERLPQSLKNYLPAELDAAQALAVHNAFLETADGPFARSFARISSVARSLEKLPVKSWPEAAPFYLKSADARLLAPEPKAEDPFNLLHALAGLAVASRKKLNPRLAETVQTMERALQAKIDWETANITTQEGSQAAWVRTRGAWDEAAHEKVLQRALELQLAAALFPFAGFGNTLSERITIIGVRLATFRLALICAGRGDVVTIAQSLARVLDHLADPTYSLQIYNETGWSREGRLRALLFI